LAYFKSVDCLSQFRDGFLLLLDYLLLLLDYLLLLLNHAD